MLNHLRCRANDDFVSDFRKPLPIDCKFLIRDLEGECKDNVMQIPNIDAGRVYPIRIHK